MDRYLRAENYLERIILNNLSAPVNSINNFDLTIRQAVGNYSSCDYEQAIAGFGFLDNGKFHVSLDKKIICHNSACISWAQKLSQLFLISENSILVTSASRASACFRPLAIGHEKLALKGGYGTMAGYIAPKNYSDPSYRIFSNNHVLSPGGKLGDRVYSMENEPVNIGEVEKFLPIYSDTPNRLDLAVARLKDYAPCESPNNIGHRLPNKSEIVTKFGSTTKYTTGAVVSTKYNVPVDYNGDTAYFKDQIMIISNVNGKKFSDKGDSGSMIKTTDGQFAGLLFADNDQQTFANKSTLVINQLMKWGYL